ncbi:MAG: preprotein translocase subunit SecE [Nitrospirae bacterium]|nr:MAG: preprotein translocase subunit SecE [Nitrospirota bacterium]
MKKLWETIREFLLDVRSELRKVTYPTYGETIGSTTVVIVLVVVVSLFLALADLLLVRVIGRII